MRLAVLLLMLMLPSLAMSAPPEGSVPTTPPPAPLRTKKKVDEKPDLNHAASKKSFLWLRGFQTSKNVDASQTQAGVLAPYQSYFLATYTFQSAAAPAKGYDYHSFASSLYFFTPHWHNFGLVGHQASSSSADSAFLRSGIYARLAGGNEKTNFLIVPAYTINDLRERSGRAVALYLVSFFKGFFLIDGSAAYVWRGGVTTTSADPVLSFRLYESLRLVLGYSYATAVTSGATTITEYKYSGFEFRTYF